MSLILEALKKSEANRRLGAAPDLGTPFSAAPQRRNLLPLLLAAIVVAGAVAWWMLRTPTPDSTTPPSAQPKPLVATRPAPAPIQTVPHPAVAQRAPALTPAPTTAPPAPVANTTANPVAPAPVAVPPATAVAPKVASMQKGNRFAGAGNPRTGKPGVTPEASDRMAAKGSRGAFTIGTPTALAPASGPASAPSAAAPRPEPAKVAAPAPAPVAIAPPPAPTPAANPEEPPARAPKTAAMTGVTAAAATPAPAAAPAAVPSASTSAKAYAELPFSLRKSLPDLHLSMHVYAVETAQRFVILNNSRMGEGDKTSDDVTVGEIRPDGVVLEFQGQRFFYPRDGL